MTSDNSKANDVDMTAKAIETRLRRVSQLRDLCISLGKATIIRDAPSGRHEEQAKRPDTQTNDDRR